MPPENLTTLEEAMGSLRTTLKVYGEQILSIKTSLINAPKTDIEDRPEELANLTLAYRHMEDCIMRLGKVIQAYQGGKSIYDKPTEVINS